MHHDYAITNGIRMHYVSEGEGPLVVLLHGFPEFWYAWRHQIPALAAAGYRVVAPDLRGFGETDKPLGWQQYSMTRLTADVAGLLDHLSAEKAHIVGHDWGGSTAWALAMHRPERVERLVVLNAPHPVQFMTALRTRQQLSRSRYMFAFQLPGMPERLIRRNDWAALRTSFTKGPVHPGAFTAEDIEQYVAAAEGANSLHGGFNYYRATFREGAAGLLGQPQRFDAPTLVIWGDQDRFILPELATPDPAWVPNCRVEHIADASHWVMSDAPEAVNGLLIGFLEE
jgi:pimeloyl-ACP methyl ester carboxylesterase